MKKLDNTCFICGSNRIGIKNKYFKCRNCGYEFLLNLPQQNYIINDILSKKIIIKLDFLDKYKIKILKYCLLENEFILDIGSGSGKFLYHVKYLFNDHLGIEVSPECLSFSKSLDLNISNNINSLNTFTSVVTFWHSLEHLSPIEIHQIYEKIRVYSNLNTTIIISIPNASSLLYKILGEKYAYYDYENHFSQFTIKSLDMLLNKYGFSRKRLYFSMPYIFFGYIQSLLNLFNTFNNYYYYRKKRGYIIYKNKIKSFLIDFYNIFLIIIFIFPCLIFTLFDLIFKEYGGVLTVCYQKKKN